MALGLGPWKLVDPDRQRRLDEMAAELQRQAAHLTAAEYRWLRLLGEFDEAGGWAPAGARSCAAWLSWACGVGPAAAREKVRVARALPSLPRVCESFAAGRLSYSKVRAISRVATPANEELLVSYGEGATAAQLESVLRHYRRVSSLDEAREAAEQYERRYVRHWVDDDGMVCVSARLSPEDGALFVAQLERMADAGGEDRLPPPAEPAASVSAEAAEQGRGDLPVVAPVWAASEPIEARRADALRQMAETAAANGPSAMVGGDTHLVVVTCGQEALRDCHVSRGPDDPATAVPPGIQGVGRVSAETARRIACDAEVATLIEDDRGRPLGVGRQSKKVPRWLRRMLVRRDRGCCQFPGCLAQRFLDAHHIIHWADGGPTDLENLLLLCRFHHRLVHEVGYRIRGTGATGVTFIRPDGSAVPRRPPVVAGQADDVEQSNLAHQLDINELTGIPDWDGKRPDYSMAVAALQDVSAEARSPKSTSMPA